MSIPLSVRVGERNISRRVDDLTFRETIHGTAEISFNLAEDLNTVLPAFERVYLYDGTSGDTIAEGRLEDPGRTLDDNGQRWDMSAIGEVGRASDHAVALVYIDTDLQRWRAAAVTTATSASIDVTEVPNQEGVDGWKLQLNPGQPIDATSNVVIRYSAIADAGMKVGFLQFTVVDGFDGPGQENRSWQGNPANQMHTVAFTTTPMTNTARLGSTLLDTGSDFLDLVLRRTASATNVGADNNWAAFYDISVGAKRVLRDGTDETTSTNYQPYVLAHQVVEDLLGRLLTSYDGVNASIDTSSTYQIDQLAWPDGITAEQVLGTLMEMLPDFYWQVGPSDVVSGKPSFTWRQWPTSPRYVISLRDGINLPGADAERYNRVTFRWTNSRGRVQTKTYDAGTTIAGVVVPDVPELAAAGPGGTRMVRSPEVQDLADEEGSEANADKQAAEFLLAHGTPPASGTLTVAHKVYDNDLGRFVQPWEIKPGHLVFVPELAQSADDYSTTGRNGKSVFRIVGKTYQVSDNAASLELDAPPRTDEVLLAEQVTKRQKKR